MRKTASYILLSLAGLGALSASSGCQAFQDFKLIGKNQTRSKTELYDDIGRVSVWVKSPLVDYDRDNVPDGVLVHVYLYRVNGDKPVAGNGAMAFRLFQREKDSEGQLVNKKLKVWNLSSDDLMQALGRDRFGFVMYRMELYWRNLRVRGPGIHIVGEFTRPDGRVVRSRILSLPIADTITADDTP